MAHKTLYIIRHGQTEYNKLGYVQGSGVDAPLNETGFSQAEAFFLKYQHVTFSKIYISKLRRTRQSVSLFIERGLPVEEYAGLNEISWGHSEGQKPTPESNAAYFKALEAWASGNTDARTPGGESPNEVLARLKPVLEHIMAQPNEDPVLICTHGRLMRVMLCHLTGKGLRYMDRFDHRNLCLYKLVYDGERFHIEVANEIAY